MFSTTDIIIASVPDLAQTVAQTDMAQMVAQMDLAQMVALLDDSQILVQMHLE